MRLTSTTASRVAAGCAALLAAPALAVCSSAAAVAEPSAEPSSTASAEPSPEPSESASPEPTPQAVTEPVPTSPPSESSAQAGGGWSWSPRASPTPPRAAAPAAAARTSQAIGGGTAALPALPGMVAAVPSAAVSDAPLVPLPLVAAAPGTVDAYDLTGQLLPVPAQLEPGDVVLVRAAGFQPGELLVVTHDDAVVPGPEAAVTDEQGRVERRFEVPGAQIAGTHTLVLRGRGSAAAWSYQVGVVRQVALASQSRTPARPVSPAVPALLGSALVVVGVGLRHKLLTARPAGDAADLPRRERLLGELSLASVSRVTAPLALTPAGARHARPVTLRTVVPAPRRGRHGAR